jgi:hypothetical protein
MASHLYLCSTPLNMLVASLIALSKPGEKHIIAAIDQPNGKTHGLFAMLQLWPHSPFAAYEIISYKQKGLFNKRQARKTAFANLQRLLTANPFDYIYTGNDRRIEFQYAMHLSPPGTTGVYMDDGTYSYIGKPSHWLNDQIIDAGIKKLTYGFWWRQPANIGGSSWITQAWLFKPEQAMVHLQNKTCFQVPAINQPAMASLTDIACQQAGLNTAALNHIQLLVLLPHESVLSPANATLLSQLLNKADPASTAVKLHPRCQQLPAQLETARQHNHTLPSSIPVELLLPVLPDCTVIADMSTVLLTIRWLRPDITVEALPQTALDSWTALLSKNHILTLSLNWSE